MNTLGDFGDCRWSYDAMQTIGINLPDFVRVAWVSDHARTVWEPRFRKINKASLELEWLSVRENARSCASISLTPADLTKRAGEWLYNGLIALPLDVEAITARNGAGNERAKPVHPDSHGIRVVVGRQRDVAAFQAAMENDNQAEMAGLLGNPSCCLSNLRKAWVDEGLTDPTWLVAKNSCEGEHGVDDLVVLKSFPECNPLWRIVGVRLLPFVPCSFHCHAASELGKVFCEIGRKCGLGQEVAWCMEILSWPIEWSCLHGIAEIKAPILKIAARTDGTRKKYRVRVNGESYPKEGATGIGFPFRNTTRARYIQLSTAPATISGQ